MVSNYFLPFLIALTSVVNSQDISTRVCSRSESDACAQLARGGELACLKNYHNVDCLFSINRDQAHLGALTPEEAFLGAATSNDDVWVIAEEVSKIHSPPKFVVIVKDSVQSGFNNLKGLRYCHPGFKNDPYFTKLMLEQFENKINNLDGQFCNLDNATLVEKHVKAVSSFFGDSCRPGLYTQDLELDSKLKAKYSSLCKLCAGDTCSVDYKNPMEDVLNCFTFKGDIAVTTVEALKNYNESNYKYLCVDGSTSTTECIWTSQLPHSVIVVNKNKATVIKTILKNAVNDSTSHQKELLFDILQLRRYSNINFDIEPLPLKDYVLKYKAIPDIPSSKKCGVSLKWCTKSSEENLKCKWLSQASLNQGFQPVVECVQTDLNGRVDGDISCIDDIKKGKSDVFTAGADYGFIAYKNSLKAIAYPETDTRFVYPVVIALKSDSPIKSVEELKGQKACIPEYAGKEWLIFVDYLRKNRLVDPVSTDFDKLISDFVGDSCMPGARSSDRVFSENVDKDKMCRQCASRSNTLTASYCNDDSENLYYGNEGALRCLNDTAGDYAVISTTEVQNVTSPYKILCKNNTVVDVSGGIKVDENCALLVIVASEVVAKVDNKNNPDYVLLLRDMENTFGISLSKPFQVFNVFNYTKDLLFKDSTPGILFSSTNVYIDNFVSLLYSLPDVVPDAANSINAVFSTVCIALLSLILYSF